MACYDGSIVVSPAEHNSYLDILRDVPLLHAPQGKQIGGGTERDAFDLKGPGSNQNRAAEIQKLKPNPGKVLLSGLATRCSVSSKLWPDCCCPCRWLHKQDIVATQCDWDAPHAAARIWCPCSCSCNGWGVAFWKAAAVIAVWSFRGLHALL